MHATHYLRLLLVALSAASVAQAAWPENEDAPRIEREVVKRVVVRQASSTGGNPSSTPTSSSSPPPGSSTRSSTSSSRGPDPTSSSSTTSRPNEDSSSSTAPQPTEETIITTITKTNSNGQLETFTSESRTTRTPGLNGKSGESSGLSTGTRNTIIGVVVGIGGAIILGALAFVAFRVWGRKKQVEENDGLMGYGGGYTGNPGYAGTLDKSEVGSSGGATTSTAARNPFQQTLETYHAPTQVNPSANF